MSLKQRLSAILVLCVAFPLSGCLFRTRKVDQNISPVNLKTATKQELVDYINKQAAQIQTMKATVDIDTAVGGARKGKVTEYKEISGFIIARKPAMLRMVGLMPVIKTTLFDMVSNGEQFQVSIPPKNRFVVGSNNVLIPNPQQPLENLRPQIIYDSLLLRRIDPQKETVVMEDGVEPVILDKGHRYEQPTYIIDVIENDGPDGAWLSRKIVFNRSTLLPDRQMIYNKSANLVTDVGYVNYKDYDGILFPAKIDIRRPQEEYNITLNVVKLDFNQPLLDKQFVLAQPPGAQVVHLDNRNSPDSGGSE